VSFVVWWLFEGYILFIGIRTLFEGSVPERPSRICERPPCICEHSRFMTPEHLVGRASTFVTARGFFCARAPAVLCVCVWGG